MVSPAAVECPLFCHQTQPVSPVLNHLNQSPNCQSTFSLIPRDAHLLENQDWKNIDSLHFWQFNNPLYATSLYIKTLQASFNTKVASCPQLKLQCPCKSFSYIWSHYFLRK
ncbi:unnamed protein product [Amaranthus hypochondriacus]